MGWGGVQETYTMVGYILRFCGNMSIACCVRVYFGVTGQVDAMWPAQALPMMQLSPR